MSEPQIQIKRFSRSKRPVSEEPPPEEKRPEPEPEREPEPEPEPEPLPQIDFEEEDDDFLNELKIGGNPIPEFVPPPPSPVKRAPKAGGGRKKKAAAFGGGDFMGEYGDLFSSEPTPIMGKNRRELLTRLSEYRTLFPTELKTFKVKQNATDAQLQEALDEAETIVSCHGVGRMMDEAILTAVQTVEAVSSRTEKYDISGTAEALRANPEFHRLCKLCWIKYRIFSNAPPEAQLMLVVASTAMVMRQKNLKRKEINGLLDQPL
jgi:hypothetical protein